MRLPYMPARTQRSKLWDQKPHGSKTLVTRGEYHLATAGGDPAAGVLKTSL